MHAQVVPMSMTFMDPEDYPENVKEIVRQVQAYIFTRRIRVKDIFLDFDPLRCGRCTQYQFVRGLNSVAPQLTASQMRTLTVAASAHQMQRSLLFSTISLLLIPFSHAIPVVSRSESTEEYLKKYGIDVEEHFVTTEDKYILRVFRLPHKNAPVVILQHGVLASSWCWLVNSPEKSLGILLWRMGYDVWLTNSRGNTFSRNHTEYNPSFNQKFWNYTFEDMGYFDVSANVRYVLTTTSKSDLTFVGWSQGTTQMFIAAQGPDRDYLKSHVNLFVALSPVSYLTHQTSLLLSVAQRFRLGVILGKAYPYDVFSWSELPTMANLLCKVTFGVLCEITVDVICGRSSVDNSDAITNLAAHFPAGTSVKDFEHYEQFIDREHFGRFDYGKEGNMEHYGVPEAPLYNASKLEMPTALFRGSKDTLGDPEDVKRLLKDLNSDKHIVFSKEYEDYSHLTWMVGLTDEWITDLKVLLKQYNPVSSMISELLV
eukprot:symbB.v1.2.030691.t3/scaffold3488.1/size55655/5